ncbi:DUF87 domain-containing protein [Clostridium botulinum]|uniref:Conjugal transfer protein TraE /TrsE n=1 Tax=Clostridium botulinum TaxID=1491 RepID=A0A0A0UVA3_CLOBO|nr:DUF87 domain-containing protein [Clostridium botulinum]AIW54615.1 conjugal transfer protein TraE /TrsE [Clostridium botulinum]AIW54734.1 conjugal transfer protein TraE /TrsE [Clostridium botulinum]AIW54864.1 conjugal transfer protein TraE /TrsE [Clostridium botulinum]MBY7009321.1 ATP-binding protein [Clostridium botulinum]NFH74452.1 DUF87 domain-containing protein [Clostridium botulinum]
MLINKKKQLDKYDKRTAKELKNNNKSIQDTIPFIAVSENGIIESDKGIFSTTLTFDDINYQIARQDDQENIFLQYCKVLNYFDSHSDVQITINNKHINMGSFRKSIELNLKNDLLDEYREEYNDMLQYQVLEGKNNIKKDMYITVSGEAKNFEEARMKFSKTQGEMQSNLKRMGSKSNVLNLNERLEVLHDFFRSGEEGGLKFSNKKIRENGLDVKNAIAPDNFKFHKNYFTMGEKFGRALYLKDLPRFLSDKFISELMEINKNMMLSIHIKPVEPDKALKLIQKQITGMEGNKIEYQKRSLKNGYLEPFIPYDLKSSLEEANELLDDVTNKNQKVFLVSVTLLHLANSKEELDDDTEVLKNISSKNICKLATLNYQQEKGLKSVLPLGINHLKIDRTLTTESTAVLMPFSSQELIQKDGMYYGKNATSRNLLMFNRKTLKNPNGFILGTPGSGKSFSAKREMTNVLLNTDDDVIIIDPEREYTSLAQGFGGEIIHISAGSKNFINPLDLNADYADEDDPMLLKSEFLLSLCECLVGGREGLAPGEKTIIDRCCKKTYADYLNSNFDESKIPTLKDFQQVLENQNEPEAQGLALDLEIYTKGSLSIFANKTNVNINNRFIVYDTKDLGKQLKTMGMLIVLDAIWNRITANRAKGKRTWLYMDEIYLLFSNEYSAQYLFELYKRARKWGAIPTGITQNIEDLLKSDLARSMLSNSDFLLMLNQAPSDREELAHLLNISDTQLSYITSSDEGEGLLFSGNSIIPFVDKFPTDTKLYEMMTTKVDEIKSNKVKESLKEGA